MRITRRDHLLEVADRLFCAHGFRATGIDRLLAEAGVAKMTLYKHFGSKDALVEAVLERRDGAFRAWIAEEVDRRASAPRERILAVFDALDGWLHAPDFRGCPFVNAVAEFGDAETPARRAAARHKHAFGGYFRDLAAAAGAPDPARLAEELMLLAEGAIALAHVAGRKSAARKARHVAERLVAEAIPAAA